MNTHSRITAPAVLGAAALATSTVLLILQIVLALPLSKPTSPTRIAAIIAAMLELSTLSLLLSVTITSIRRDSERRVTALVFGGGIVLCVMAAALTVATLICLSSSKTLGVDTLGFLEGTAIMLVVSFPLQLLFLVSGFTANRTQQNEQSPTRGMQEYSRRPSPHRVKTIPYSRTSAPCGSHPSSRTVSMDSRRAPGSSGGFSASTTIYSMASEVEKVVRSASSKARHFSSNRSSYSQRSQRSQRSGRRAASMDSYKQRERTTSPGGDSFDSWDTSGMEPQKRLLVIETSSPIGVGGSRFLETIPASPTTSRSGSPGTPHEYERPRMGHRSRSFSPATSTRSALPAPPKRAFTQHTSASESHIHPLFRSDSSTPPPMASPGTIVIAAPQAGQIISDRSSVRSLSRLRSGSLPAVSSPLTTSGSFESFRSAMRDHNNGSNSNAYKDKTFSATSDESLRSDETALGEVLEEEPTREVPERKITPPVPDYILNAGSPASLHVYPVRKTPSRDGPRGPGLDALDASW